jgi:cleavage stimulation factor subunit 1
MTNFSVPIGQVWCNPDGRFYVSCSTDGAIKVWDGASSRCVNTFAGAHGGAEVCGRGKHVSLGHDVKVGLFLMSSSFAESHQ